MCSFVSGNFLKEWRVEKKTPDTLFTGSFDQDTYTHTDPYLDLDFRKKRNLAREAPKKRNLAGEAPKKRNLAGEAPKNVTWQGRHQKT